jgi:hypothetical protein
MLEVESYAPPWVIPFPQAPDSGQILSMTRVQKLIARYGGALVILFVAVEVLAKVKNFYEAPGTVVTVAGFLRRMFTELSTTGFVILAIGILCLLQSMDWWPRFLAYCWRTFQSTQKHAREALAGAQPSLPPQQTLPRSAAAEMPSPRPPVAASQAETGEQRAPVVAHTPAAARQKASPNERLSWSLSSPFDFGSGDAGIWVTWFRIIGWNNSPEPLVNVRACVITQIGGQKVPLQFQIGPNERVDTADMYIEPGGGRFTLSGAVPSPPHAHGSHGYTPDQYLEKVGGFTFVFEADGGVKFEHTFSYAEVKAIILAEAAILAPKPPAPTVKRWPAPSGPQPRKPTYTPTDLTNILDALARLREALDQKDHPLIVAVEESELRKNLGHGAFWRIRIEGKTQRLRNDLDGIQGLLADCKRAIDNILASATHYPDEVGTTVEGFDVVFDMALRELASLKADLSRAADDPLNKPPALVKTPNPFMEAFQAIKVWWAESVDEVAAATRKFREWSQ